MILSNCTKSELSVELHKQGWNEGAMVAELAAGLLPLHICSILRRMGTHFSGLISIFTVSKCLETMF